MASHSDLRVWHADDFNDGFVNVGQACDQRQGTIVSSVVQGGGRKIVNMDVATKDSIIK